MKGQTSYDFVISIILFSLLLYISYTTLIQLIIHPIVTYQPSYVWAASELLLLPGDPPDWTALDEADVFGLGLYKNGFWRPNALDPRKLMLMNGTSCTEIAKKLGIGQEIEIRVIDGNKTYYCIPSQRHNTLIVRYASINWRSVRIEVRA